MFELYLPVKLCLENILFLQIFMSLKLFLNSLKLGVKQYNFTKLTPTYIHPTPTHILSENVRKLGISTIRAQFSVYPWGEFMTRPDTVVSPSVLGHTRPCHISSMATDHYNCEAKLFWNLIRKQNVFSSTQIFG